MKLTVEITAINTEMTAQILEQLAQDLRRKALKGDVPDGFIASVGGWSNLHAEWKEMT